jgi:sugar phosphate isomerase/epimerase
VKLVVFASAWAFGSVAECRRQIDGGNFDGIESPLPADDGARAEFRRELATARVPFIAEVCTGGSYAPPSSVSFAQHFDDFVRQISWAAEAGARLVTCLAGSDSWPLSRAIEFYGGALEIGRRAGVELSFETHRSRPTFTPWATRDLLLALPEMRLTCDFSHWCVVCERLVDDEDVLALVVSRATHIHARVGYAQGPQVPDPRAPEYATELAAHEGWWTRIWDSAESRGAGEVSLTPEFGPDGYLHHLPFTNVPVADLYRVNGWMALRQKQRFTDRSSPP